MFQKCFLLIQASIGFYLFLNNVRITEPALEMCLRYVTVHLAFFLSKSFYNGVIVQTFALKVIVLCYQLTLFPLGCDVYSMVSWQRGMQQRLMIVNRIKCLDRLKLFNCTRRSCLLFCGKDCNKTITERHPNASLSFLQRSGPD